MRNTQSTKGGARVPGRSEVVRLRAVPVPMIVAVDSQESEMVHQLETIGHTKAKGRSSPVYRLLVFEDGASASRDELSSSEQELPFTARDIVRLEEVAAVLHVERAWLVRKARTRRYPFIRRLSRKKYCCSRILLRRWLASGSPV